MKCRVHVADTIKICQDLANIHIALEDARFFFFLHGNDVL